MSPSMQSTTTTPLSIEQSLTQCEGMFQGCGGLGHINALLSSAFGCPFEGSIGEARVFDLVERFSRMGIERVSLCDTTGMANPAQVEHLFAESKDRWPHVQFTAHFHNTRGMGLANALAALEAGIDRFDSSLGGLGGCPVSPGAARQFRPERLVDIVQVHGVETG